MKNTLGSAIRVFREAKGIDQYSLAAQIGCTRTAVCNYESGRREVPIEILKDIARHLEVDPLDLLQIKIADQIANIITGFKESK